MINLGISLSLLMLSPLTSHVSRLTSHVSRLTSHVSPLTSHLSPLTSHLSSLISHLSSLISHLSSLMYYSSLLSSSPHLVFPLPTSVLCFHSLSWCIPCSSGPEEYVSSHSPTSISTLIKYLLNQREET